MTERLPDFTVSAGEDDQNVREKIEGLVDQSGWEIVDNTIKKTFYFQTFTKVLDFVNVVGVRCKSKSHHPVAVLKFSSASFEWTTHVPPGISEKDVLMANYCDEQARQIGAVEPDEAPSCQ